MNQDQFQQFQSGTMHNAHDYFGAHMWHQDGTDGVIFRLWAPSARQVYVRGSFNNWNNDVYMPRVEHGIFEVFIPNVHQFHRYKYNIETATGDWVVKADPYAFFSDQYPTYDSVVYHTEYHFQDNVWLEKRKSNNILEAPILIYEVHLGSWRKTLDDMYLTYRDIAHQLIAYVKDAGFTHIELMPITEHPYLGSWGYQQTGFFSVTSRYGTPDDLRYLIDYAHQHDIGVIIDFVPVHFCKDSHGLALFDGTPLYEYSDEALRENVLWGTYHFDLGKGDVRSFLLSALDFFAYSFHIDGIRYDAVANLIYRLGKKENGENREGQEALRHINGIMKHLHPDVMLIAEDSSDYSGVTTSTLHGGLGFDFKWDLGFANDHFTFMKTPYIDRKYKSECITFARYYHDTAHFLLPYSHDEVVHGKKTLLNKQQGNQEERFAALSVELAFWLMHPGKKLLFMGQEFAHQSEWDEKKSLDWHLFTYSDHADFFEASKRLFHMYQMYPAMYRWDYQLDKGFDWALIDTENSIYGITRRSDEQMMVGIFNFDLQGHGWYPLQLQKGRYRNVLSNEIMVTDEYGCCHIGLNRLSYHIYVYEGEM